jgi:hypothetical protein
MRWIVVVIVAGGCWHAEPPSPPTPRAAVRDAAFGCFTWGGADRHGTVCAPRADCEALRDNQLSRDDSWSYGRCTAATSIACFTEVPDFPGSHRPPDVERCFAGADECERYRARIRSRDATCRVLQSPPASSLIAP